MLQTPHIALVMSGNTHNEHWDIPNRKLDFFDIKGIAENLLSLQSGAYNLEFEASQHDVFHPGQCANIVLNGKVIGVIGAIHPKFAKPLGLNGQVFAFELQTEHVSGRKIPEAAVISKFPAIRRDLALVVSDQVKTGKLLNSIEKIGISNLVDINLFDMYTGEGISDGEKSLALSIWLQSVDKTLEDQEIQDSVDKVVRHLRDNFSAALRD